MGQKKNIFQDNIGLLVLTHFSWKKKIILFCLGIFQIQLLGEEIWGKNYIFQDNIELWVLKCLSKKWPTFVLEFFKSYDLDMGQKLHFSR